METEPVDKAVSSAAYGCFVAGLVMMVLFALGHLGGFLQARHAARHDPAMADLMRAMREHRVSLMGFHPSILDFREYFSVNFSILLLLGAAAGFAGLYVSQDTAAAIRVLSVVYLVAMIALLATSLIYSVAQGVVTCSVIGLLFTLAWWRA